jgi:hypothetical protein
MKTKNLILFTLISTFLFFLSCKEKEFIPPNTQSVKIGNAEKVVPTGTAKQLLKYADKMAEVWSKKYELISVNGDAISIDGYNKNGDKSSKWMFNYKSNETKNGYTVIFNGDNSASWVEVSSFDNNNNTIKDFIDSTEAISLALKEGMKEGDYYTMELYNNKKGFNWVIGSKIKQENKYDIKSIVASNEK